MTVQVRVTREDAHSDKVVGVFTLDKKSKKSTLYTKLINKDDAAVMPVYDSQDLIIRELDT